MADDNATTQRPVRHFELPPTLAGRLWTWRYLILRRLVQCGLLLLFFGTFNWGWSVAGLPVLRGNLSASELFGAIPMADPFAGLQILLTGHWLEARVLIGALIILLVYTLIGGRVFCSWVCPLNPVTDLAGWLRIRLGITQTLRLSRGLRYWLLALSLVLSFFTGVAAFEWISPIGMLHRELIFGVGFGWVAVVGIFVFDLVVIKHGWCGHLCPLGAFYAQLGQVARVRVSFDAGTCTHCGDCAQVCPEPQVLNLKKAAQAGMVASGECTNCGRCTPVCPEGSLRFDWRARIGRRQSDLDTRGSTEPPSSPQRRAA